MSLAAVATLGGRRIGRAATLLTGAVVLLIVLWLVYLGLTWDLRRSAADPPVNFRAVRVVRADLRETVAASGTMESVTRVAIKSEVAGVVRKVAVEEGERVTEGQPLVELDLDRLADRVAELRAALDGRRAAARQDVVARARADLAQVRKEYERITALFQRGIVSGSEHDVAVHALRVAEIAAADAEAERASRDAAVAQAQAALQRAVRDHEHGVLRAPIAGVVIQRAVDPGAPVADMSASNGGTLVAVVADDRNLRLVAQVDEHDIAQVRVGAAAEVRIDALPGETFSGTVRKVSSAGTLDEKIANFQVEIGLPADERVRVGMSADARVLVDDHRAVLLVPNTAILRAADGARLRLVDPAGGQPFRLVSIREGYSDGFQTVVAEGVSEGDQVLVRSGGDGG